MGYTVHVNNLSFKIQDEEELKALFENKFGEVKKVHLVKDEHGRSKGYAFIEFLEERDMNKAIKEKEITIKERLAIIKKSSR